MPSRLRRALLALSAASLVACGSDGSDPVVQGNALPAWSDAPSAPVEVGQGRTISLPLTLSDPDNDQPTAQILAEKLPADLEVEIAPDGQAITVHPGYAISGQASFSIQVDDGHGGKVDVAVTLNVTPIRWFEGQTWPAGMGPEPREHGSFVVDADRQRAFLIGGSGYAPQGTPLGDVWRYDLVTGAMSTEAPTGDVPPPGASRRVAQIPGQPVAYLFGGYGDSFAGNKELYRVKVDGDTPDFELITQQGAPPARSLHMFTYDAATDRFFVFGGFGSAPLKDTWMMKLDGDQAIWTKLSPATSPSARYGFFYGVDEVNGRVVLFSGAQGTQPLNAARDTWVLDMRSEPPAWELVAEGESVPPGRRNGCAVFDPTGPRLVVFGGTSNGMTTEEGLWLFDARPAHPTWTEVTRDGEPPLRSSGFGLHDPISGRTLLGFGNDMGIYADLWPLGY